MAPMFRLERHWIVTIKQKRKRHIAASGKNGHPLSVTLCKFAYKPGTHADRGNVLAFDECPECIGIFLKAIADIQSGGG